MDKDCDHDIVSIDPDTIESPDDGVIEMRGYCALCGEEIVETYYRESQAPAEKV